MNILHVNYADIAGGAEAIALRLHQGYRLRGHRSRIAVARKRSTDPDIALIDNRRPPGLIAGYWPPDRAPRWIDLARGPARLLSRFHLALTDPGRHRRRRRGEEDFDFPATWNLLRLGREMPDVLHLHNLHGNFFDLRVLPIFSRRLPVFLTLHDAWLLSGHCAHSFECERWKTGCGQCPDLSLYPTVSGDATDYNWARKARLYARSRLYVATPSRWLMSRVQESMLAPAVAEARVIGNGIDLSVFRPDDRERARAEVGLPNDAKVLLFTAVTARTNPFKDYATVRAAVERITQAADRPKLVLLVVGEDTRTERLNGADVHFVPFCKPERFARYCQAADLCLHAARAEVWGLTVTEAMACGVPVVGSAVGGIPEQIDDGVNGYCVPPRDSAAMAEAALNLLRNPSLLRSFGEAAAAKAQARFGRDLMEERYLEWYESVLRQWGRAPRVGPGAEPVCEAGEVRPDEPAGMVA